MNRPDRHDAANDAIADVARKWLGRQHLSRDRDLPENVRHAVRITAFLQRKDDRWQRGELIVADAAEQLVWQPYPHGRPLIIAGPFLLGEAVAAVGAKDPAVRQVELVTIEDRFPLKITEGDLAVLARALRSEKN